MSNSRQLQLVEWRRSLDGWWIAREASLGGVPLGADLLPALAMLLFNRTLYLGSDVGTIDIDRGLSPATLDILVTRGPNRSRFIPGIFQQHGQVLHLCLDLLGADRPRSFLAPFGSRLLVVTYQRAPLRDMQVMEAERAGRAHDTAELPPRQS